jgi:hypothetical protein
VVREHGIAEECQPVAARRQADHAVPAGVAAGATDDHSRRHLVLRLEWPLLAAVQVDEPLFSRPKHVREPAKSVAREIGRRPELGLADEVVQDTWLLTFPGDKQITYPTPGRVALGPDWRGRCEGQAAAGS